MIRVSARRPDDHRASHCPDNTARDRSGRYKSPDVHRPGALRPRVPPGDDRVRRGAQSVAVCPFPISLSCLLYLSGRTRARARRAERPSVTEPQDSPRLPRWAP
jgi:hypothetical protein